MVPIAQSPPEPGDVGVGSGAAPEPPTTPPALEPQPTTPALEPQPPPALEPQPPPALEPQPPPPPAPSSAALLLRGLLGGLWVVAGLGTLLSGVLLLLVALGRGIPDDFPAWWVAVPWVFAMGWRFARSGRRLLLRGAESPGFGGLTLLFLVSGAVTAVVTAIGTDDVVRQALLRFAVIIAATIPLLISFVLTVARPTRRLLGMTAPSGAAPAPVPGVPLLAWTAPVTIALHGLGIPLIFVGHVRLLGEVEWYGAILLVSLGLFFGLMVAAVGQLRLARWSIPLGGITGLLGTAGFAGGLVGAGGWAYLVVARAHWEPLVLRVLAVGLALTLVGMPFLLQFLTAWRHRWHVSPRLRRALEPRGDGSRLRPLQALASLAEAVNDDEPPLRRRQFWVAIVAVPLLALLAASGPVMLSGMVDAASVRHLVNETVHHWAWYAFGVGGLLLCTITIVRFRDLATGHLWWPLVAVLPGMFVRAARSTFPDPSRRLGVRLSEMPIGEGAEALREATEGLGVAALLSAGLLGLVVIAASLRARAVAPAPRFGWMSASLLALFGGAAGVATVSRLVVLDAALLPLLWLVMTSLAMAFAAGAWDDRSADASQRVQAAGALVTIAAAGAMASVMLAVAGRSFALATAARQLGSYARDADAAVKLMARIDGRDHFDGVARLMADSLEAARGAAISGVVEWGGGVALLLVTLVVTLRVPRLVRRLGTVIVVTAPVVSASLLLAVAQTRELTRLAKLGETSDDLSPITVTATADFVRCPDLRLELGKDGIRFAGRRLGASSDLDSPAGCARIARAVSGYGEFSIVPDQSTTWRRARCLMDALKAPEQGGGSEMIRWRVNERRTPSTGAPPALVARWRPARSCVSLVVPSGTLERPPVNRTPAEDRAVLAACAANAAGVTPPVAPSSLPVRLSLPLANVRLAKEGHRYELTPGASHPLSADRTQLVAELTQLLPSVPLRELSLVAVTATDDVPLGDLLAAAGAINMERPIPTFHQSLPVPAPVSPVAMAPTRTARRAEPPLAELEIPAGVDEAALWSWLWERRSSLAACHAPSLVRGRNHWGRFLVALNVDDRGRVARAEVTRAAVQDPTLRACLERALSNGGTPVASGPAAVVLPVDLCPP